MMYDVEEVDSDTERKHFVYTAKEFGNDNRCAHVFRRVSPYKVQCTKCSNGLYDNPECPLPISELNEYYAGEKTQAFNKWL